MKDDDEQQRKNFFLVKNYKIIGIEWAHFMLLKAKFYKSNVKLTKKKNKFMHDRFLCSPYIRNEKRKRNGENNLMNNITIST